MRQLEGYEHVYRGPAKRPYYLLRASYTPDALRKLQMDGTPLPPEGDFPDHVATEQFKEDMKPSAPKEFDPNSFQGLQQRCKAHGLNSMTKSKRWMLEEIAKKELNLGGVESVVQVGV